VERGCVSLIRHYHDEIDAAVAEASGSRDLVPSTEHPGAGPSASHSAAPSGSLSPPQKGEGLDEIILERKLPDERFAAWGADPSTILRQGFGRSPSPALCDREER
jgi:hypothetical protein